MDFFQVKAILQHKVSFIKIVFLHNEDAINLLQLPDQPISGLLLISGIDSDVLSKFSPPYHWFSFQVSMIMMTDTILMKDSFQSFLPSFKTFALFPILYGTVTFWNREALLGTFDTCKWSYPLKKTRKIRYLLHFCPPSKGNQMGKKAPQ